MAEQNQNKVKTFGDVIQLWFENRPLKLVINFLLEAQRNLLETQKVNVKLNQNIERLKGYVG